MKKKLVRIVSLVLCLVTITALCATAYAASTSYPSVSKTNYCEFIAEKKIPVYQYSTCRDNERGTCSPNAHYNAYISAGDKCYMYKITSTYIQVNYPTPNDPYTTRRTGYIRRSDLKDNYSNELLPKNNGSAFSSRGKANTYYFSNGKACKYGYTEKYDTVYCCVPEGQCYDDNGWIPIIYTAKNGNQGYKLGYVRGYDFNRIKG